MYSLYDSLCMPEADALHSVMTKLKLDQRCNKIDLGVGIYKDATGQSSVMRAVKEAEHHLVEHEHSKMYLGLEGVAAFIENMSQLLCPKGLDDRIAKIQTVGGTGGIRLAIEMAFKTNPDLTVYVGTSTWPNHIGICQALAVNHVTYDYINKDKQSINYESMFETIHAARPGDIIVLHGPCHNPTGIDLSNEEYLNIITLASNKGVIPLIDAAYYGLGNALENDLRLLNDALTICPEAFLIMSCSKAFSLYRERVGILFSATKNTATKHIVQASLEKLARNNYSMPPSHGAQCVATVLSNSSLKKQWTDELDDMRNRVLNIRESLYRQANGNPVMQHLPHQKGIFSLLELTKTNIDKLAKQYAIYLPNSGRINIAGFKQCDEPVFIDAINNLENG